MFFPDRHYAGLLRFYISRERFTTFTETTDEMYTLKRKTELETAAWAGGTTTQLAIHPEGSEYRKFDFEFRMSYATVETEESVFTFMPGVTRHLMILRGSLEIDHLDRYKKKLEKFDMDIFSGEWPTRAKGKVMDFNLMTTGSAAGGLEAIVLREQQRILPVADGTTFTGLYLLKGDLQVIHGEEHIRLSEGDFIIFSAKHRKETSIKANGECEIIKAEVRSEAGAR
jgi:uncharacterized protein